MECINIVAARRAPRSPACARCVRRGRASSPAGGLALLSPAPRCAARGAEERGITYKPWGRAARAGGPALIGKWPSRALRLLHVVLREGR